MKVHILGLKREKTLPFPEFVGLAPASEHDLNAFRQISPHLENGEIFADLAYMDELEKQLLKERGSEIFTPVKKKKGQKSLEMFDALFSAAMSGARRPETCNSVFRCSGLPGDSGLPVSPPFPFPARMEFP